MTLDIKTIPPVVIKEGTYGAVEIIKDNFMYFLKYNDIEWHQYNEENMREYYEQWSAYDLAYGNVLLSGFGFGQIATWLAAKPEVKSITVIEKSLDVITAFLANNNMPDNITVIIDDAYTYSTDKKYDCIIWDHIPNGDHSSNFYKELCLSAKNIKHDLFWFWSIEFYYTKFYYGMTINYMYNYKTDFNKFDFSKSWQKLRQVLDMPTIPDLPKSKIDSYIYNYFLREL